jgi:hypothetical protein
VVGYSLVQPHHVVLVRAVGLEPREPIGPGHFDQAPVLDIERPLGCEVLDAVADKRISVTRLIDCSSNRLCGDFEHLRRRLGIVRPAGRDRVVRCKSPATVRRCSDSARSAARVGGKCRLGRAVPPELLGQTIASSIAMPAPCPRCGCSRGQHRPEEPPGRGAMVGRAGASRAAGKPTPSSSEIWSASAWSASGTSRASRMQSRCADSADYPARAWSDKGTSACR